MASILDEPEDKQLQGPWKGRSIFSNGRVTSLIGLSVPSILEIYRPVTFITARPYVHLQSGVRRFILSGLNGPRSASLGTWMVVPTVLRRRPRRHLGHGCSTINAST